MTRYTDEQQAVIESNAELLVINAFAGTGKTTMLAGYTEARPKSKILYLAFNRAVAEEAKARFSHNVDAKTSHGLAFSSHGSKFRSKLGNPRAFHARNFLKLKMNNNEAMVLSGLALDAINRFFASASTDLNEGHVIQGQVNAAGFDRTDVLDAAKRLWVAMQDVGNAGVPMPHDGYLKLYQISEPDLGRYDSVLLDEGQDTNPCVYQIFASQHTDKVIVGDQHQGIYSFRGAMNAMKRIRDAEQHTLTASFRFGQPVADVANVILGVFKEERNLLRGMGEGGSVGYPQKGLHTAFLHRTNAGLFGRAVDLVHANARIHFVGGVKSYNFEAIHDAWRVMDGDHKAIRDPFMRSFRNFDDMESYAETVNDCELKARINVVRKYAFRIPRLLERLEAADEQDVARAHASCTTAHKSKGLEFDQVVLGDDFANLMHDSGVPLVSNLLPVGAKAEPLSDEEANLIYVACTRARKNLVITESIRELLTWRKKNPSLKLASN